MLPWYVAGPLIGLTVPLVYWYGGRKWGVSSTFRDLCAATVPAGLEYFRYAWREQGGWRLTMAVGLVAGGFLSRYLGPASQVAISEATRDDLGALGLTDFSGLVPAQVFSWEALMTLPGLLMVVGGGFLVGFGARYAGGCTSGHAISGLATLQVRSLVAVLGFFAGGLLSTHVILPWVMAATGS